MSRDHALSLNEQQTRLIHAIANTFQPSLRLQFLASVQDNLEGRGSHISAGDIVAAIENVRTILAYSYDDYEDCC
jgi:hypothetical protein